MWALGKLSICTPYNLCPSHSPRLCLFEVLFNWLWWHRLITIVLELFSKSWMRLLELLLDIRRFIISHYLRYPFNYILIKILCLLRTLQEVLLLDLSLKIFSFLCNLFQIFFVLFNDQLVLLHFFILFYIWLRPLHLFWLMKTSHMTFIEFFLAINGSLFEIKKRPLQLGCI